MIVESKMAQPVEPDEEPVNRFSSIGRKMKKHSFYSRMLVQPVEVRSRFDQGVVEVQRSPTKH